MSQLLYRYLLEKKNDQLEQVIFRFPAGVGSVPHTSIYWSEASYKAGTRHFPERFLLEVAFPGESSLGVATPKVRSALWSSQSGEGECWAFLTYQAVYGRRDPTHKVLLLQETPSLGQGKVALSPKAHLSFSFASEENGWAVNASETLTLQDYLNLQPLFAENKTVKLQPFSNLASIPFLKEAEIPVQLRAKSLYSGLKILPCEENSFLSYHKDYGALHLFLGHLAGALQDSKSVDDQGLLEWAKSLLEAACQESRFIYEFFYAGGHLSPGQMWLEELCAWGHLRRLIRAWRGQGLHGGGIFRAFLIETTEQARRTLAQWEERMALHERDLFAGAGGRTRFGDALAISKKERLRFQKTFESFGREMHMLEVMAQESAHINLSPSDTQAASRLLASIKISPEGEETNEQALKELSELLRSHEKIFSSSGRALILHPLTKNGVFSLRRRGAAGQWGMRSAGLA